MTNLKDGPMNYSAEICNAVLYRKLTLVSAICDAIGMSTRQCDQLISRLCGEGTLRRDRDYLYVKNEGKAKLLAEQAQNSGAAIQDNAAARVAARMAANALPAQETSDAPKARKKHPALPMVAVPADLVVEKGVEIPPKRWGKQAAPCPWPFASMDINDSFSIPVADGMLARDVAAVLRKAASSFKAKNPTFLALIRTEEGDKSVRLWRISPLKAVPAAAAPEPPPPAKSSLGVRLPKGKRNGALLQA